MVPTWCVRSESGARAESGATSKHRRAWSMGRVEAARIEMMCVVPDDLLGPVGAVVRLLPPP